MIFGRYIKQKKSHLFVPASFFLIAVTLLASVQTGQNFDAESAFVLSPANSVSEKSVERGLVSGQIATRAEAPLIDPVNGPLVLKNGHAKTILHAKSRYHALAWEIADDANFKNIKKKKTTLIYSMDAKLNKAGRFYVRTRGIDRRGRKTQWSQSALIEVVERNGSPIAGQTRLRKLANVEVEPPSPPPVPMAILNPIATASPITAPAVTAPVPTTKPAEAIRHDEKSSIGLRAFFGAGINFVRYTENLSNVNTSYGDLRGPSYSVGTAMDLNDHYAVEASYKDTPFIFNNSSANVNNLSGQWQTVALGLSQKSDGASKWTDRVLSDTVSANEVRWHYGLQLHQIPIPFFDIYHEPYLKTVQLLNASAGASWERYWNPWTRTTMLVNLQYPISSSTSTGDASFQVTPVILFDGSLGIDKKLSTNYWLGLHWYGQYQNIGVSYSDNQVSASGAMSVFFSTIELRLTFDY